MKAAEWAVQQAIYTRLNGVIAYPIYNGIPPDELYPVVSFGIAASTDFMAKGQTGQILIANFDCWSRQQTDQEVGEMFNDILENMTVSQDVTPSMITTTNFWIVNQFLFNTSIIQDVDGRTRHGILQMEIWTQQK